MERKLEMMKVIRNQLHNSDESVGAAFYRRSGKGVPTAMGDSGVTPEHQRKQNQRPRASNYSKLQERRDSGICLDFNQQTSIGGPVTQRTSSLEIFNAEDILVVPCSGSSDKNHQCSLENEQSDISPACVGGQSDQHASSGDSQENGDMDMPSSDSSNLDHMLTQKIKHGDMAAGKMLLPLNPQKIPWKEFRVDRRNRDLLLPNLSWEEKVVFTLNMVRCRELFEDNPKTYCFEPTRFCQFNIAFFDLDKESDFKREPQLSKIPDSYWDLDGSINVISIKVAKSDVPFPINVYGTVLARDEVDYRCVYLFNRGRDNPQHIASTDDTLTLTGPYRALAGTDNLYFEFNLKIIGEAGIDQVFSKALEEYRCVSASHKRPETSTIRSYLSELKMVSIYVPFALEASIEVNILNKKSHFHGKITAGDNKNGILLYDSKVAGTETKLDSSGTVWLTRRVVAVPWGRDLVLKFAVPFAKQKSISLEWYEEECDFKLGTYEVHVKVIWTGVLTKQRAKLLKQIGRAFVLW